MPDREKIKKLVTNLLIAFVLITIGFSLGKHSVLSRATVNADVLTATTTELPAGKKAVKVFYMHSTFRCITCNDIEARALALVDKEFTAAKQSQTLLWEDVNFQENEALAKQFDVVASCIVIATMQGAQVVDFVRLDEVWTLIEKPDEFNTYVRNALNNAFTKITGE